ncbi:TetR/AcrR family transcriptional regulator [Arthrobacter castelli]|uniref:TetR/AcrR family transcriptional regulator n=1 Tax=Arthrobacter castelli TaxID=271431 RepID=UPI000568CD4D|nr:TetR/AcrR family transcriptional regulator [Arthrobacter castelli]
MNSSFEQVGGSRPRSAETRQRLLTAASELIAEAGWGRVTTRAVAERAGLPLGAVSYHFRGKQELLSQAALETVEAIFPLRELANVQTLVELLGMIKTSVGNRESFDPVVSAMLLETLRESGRDPALRERMVTLLRDYRQLLAELVRSEQNRGAVAADADPAAVASLIAGAGDGLLMHALVDPRLDVTASVETLLALLSGGGGDVSGRP